MKRWPSIILAVGLLSSCGFVDRDVQELALLKQAIIDFPAYNGGYVPPFSDRVPGLAGDLESAAHRIGISVDDPDPRCQLAPGAFGTSWLSIGCIAIEKTLGPEARAHVLAHELGHFMAPQSLSRVSDYEIFAESVSYLVVIRAIEDYEDVEDTRRVYAGYMTKHKGALSVMDFYRGEILESALIIWELAR